MTLAKALCPVFFPTSHVLCYLHKHVDEHWCIEHHCMISLQQVILFDWKSYQNIWWTKQINIIHPHTHTHTEGISTCSGICILAWAEMTPSLLMSLSTSLSHPQVNPATCKGLTLSPYIIKSYRLQTYTFVLTGKSYVMSSLYIFYTVIHIPLSQTSLIFFLLNVFIMF